MDRLTRRAAPFFLAAFLGASLFARTLLSAPPGKTAAEEGRKTITIVGESESSARPELGVVTLSFTGYGWTVEKSKNRADQLIRKFLDKLAKEGIAPSRKEIGEPRLKPSYQFNRDIKASVTSDFLVSRQVQLEYEDPSLIGKVMDASLSIGSFFLESVRLTVKDNRSLQALAFQKTMEEGRRKAEALAKSMGQVLGEPVAAEEISSGVQDVELIQKTELAELAAGSLKTAGSEAPAENSRPRETETILPSGEGFLALPEGEEKEEGGSADSASGPRVRARSKLKITFSLR